MNWPFPASFIHAWLHDYNHWQIRCRGIRHYTMLSKEKRDEVSSKNVKKHKRYMNLPSTARRDPWGSLSHHNSLSQTCDWQVDEKAKTASQCKIVCFKFFSHTPMTSIHYNLYYIPCKFLRAITDQWQTILWLRSKFRNTIISSYPTMGIDWKEEIIFHLSCKIFCE